MAKPCVQTGCLVFVCVLCLATIGFSIFVLVSLKAKEEIGDHANIHLVIDDKRMQSCPKDAQPTSLQLPCFSGPNEYVTRGGGVGPLKCKDDYYDEEGGRSFCDTGRDTFYLNEERNAVVVQKSGIYRIYGQVTFKDRNEAHVDVLLHINGKSFTQCHQQNYKVGSDMSAPYTTCTLNGERRLREGDRLELFLPHKSRTINSYYKTTFWGIVRMASLPDEAPAL